MAAYEEDDPEQRALRIPVLEKVAHEGYAIITPIPSCTLMFKQEIPLLLPNDADAQAVKAAMMDPFEYMIARNKDGHWLNYALAILGLLRLSSARTPTRRIPQCTGVLCRTWHS